MNWWPQGCWRGVREMLTVEAHRVRMLCPRPPGSASNHLHMAGRDVDVGDHTAIKFSMLW